LSAKPSVEFIEQVAQATSLTMTEAESVKVTTNIDDVLQQLLLPQFHGPFLGNVPEDKRADLLHDAATVLKCQEAMSDAYRCWHFFVFKKHAALPDHSI
jgi:hypothetical protein